jgi:phosphosulfolactate synthase (CoM biosynthesis protein A)
MDKILEKIEEATKIDKTIGSSSNNLNGNMFTSTRSSTENSTTDQKIVVEANEGVNVGIYDEKGSIKWGTVGALTSKLPPSKFIFETPLESQQSALIAEFGQRVNLAEIRPNLVAPIELQRLGIVSKATYGISYLRKTPEGVPASKSR